MANDFFTSLTSRIKPYTDGERDASGLVICPVCGERKEYIKEGFPYPLPVMCACDRIQHEEAKLRRKEAEFKMALRSMWESDGICATEFRMQRFSDDDGTGDINRLAFCKHYAEHWDEYYNSNIGLFLYGDMGTGKSFAAHCIANHVMEQGVRVCVTNMPRLFNLENKSGIGDKLKRYQLLVIDDLGAERGTSYGQELLYSIIDARYQSGLPLIVTSNLDYADIEVSDNRSYNRIVEMCPIVLKFEGKNRRQNIAKQAVETARRIMKDA